MMERVAIPIWLGRISPVLDSAEQVWIYEVGSEEPGSQRVVEAGPNDIRRRTEFLCRLGVSTLLCGALSRPFHNLLVNAGITVKPWLTGDVEDVLAAYVEGRLDTGNYQMPGCRRRAGCRGRGMGRQHRHKTDRES